MQGAGSSVIWAGGVRMCCEGNTWPSPGSVGSPCPFRRSMCLMFEQFVADYAKVAAWQCVQLSRQGTTELSWTERAVTCWHVVPVAVPVAVWCVPYALRRCHASMLSDSIATCAAASKANAGDDLCALVPCGARWRTVGTDATLQPVKVHRRVAVHGQEQTGAYPWC